ncbi:protein pellino-like [Tropilaelaps mercedesae]|uniref:Protein pellino-like n=1 Tax=Tropilaelaps mercedesae TaxID=418985 RepID=A0A1V9XTV7_9ACAR|nr:protein pellino-like [Tropilaelaps mercedesae]
MQRRPSGSTPRRFHQPEHQEHSGVCSNDDLLANLHLSEVISVEDQTQEHHHGSLSPQLHKLREPHQVPQKQQVAGAHQQQQHSNPQIVAEAGPVKPHASPQSYIAEPFRGDTDAVSGQSGGATKESGGQLYGDYQQEPASVKYGELVLLGYNGSLPAGTEKGRRRSKYVLSRRPLANGVRAARHVSAADPAASAAVLDASQHSIAYTLSRHQAVVVLYERDLTTDMFQIGRSKESQIDFVVMDTPPPHRTIINDIQQIAQQQHLEQHLNRRHHGQPQQAQLQQQQQQRNGDFRSGISRYACRLIVERQAQRKSTQQNRYVEKIAVDTNTQGIYEESPLQQMEYGHFHRDNEDCPARGCSKVNDDEGDDEWIVRVFAAGFDSSSNIFLGENASAWQGAGGAIDGLTTNGVLLMQPMGEFGELPAATDGSPGVARAAGVWREVSVAGGIYGLRESRAARRAGPRIAGEKNVLCDGALIDLCGATLLFRSARALRSSPTRAELLEQVARLNAGRPQCPVGLNTLVVPSRATLSNRDHERQPYVYLRCGHVQGLHAWGRAANGGSNGNGANGSDWRKCPMCLTCGPVARLAMGIEPAFCVDRGPPAWAFRPCGHMASERTVKYWAAVPTPHGAHGLNAICPFCAARLCDQPGYVRLIFQDNID